MYIDPLSLRSCTGVLRKTHRVIMMLAVLWKATLPDAFTRQVQLHSSLAFTRNIQLRCHCLQGAARNHRASTGLKTMEPI